ncbi:MAG: TraR/DksA family transcriptional regulator [Phycisphaerae bacterium]|nr:TraR/DksA family transcriptional regulator [Phycisphaerae bacterium]
MAAQKKSKSRATGTPASKKAGKSKPAPKPPKDKPSRKTASNSASAKPTASKKTAKMEKSSKAVSTRKSADSKTAKPKSEASRPSKPEPKPAKVVVDPELLRTIRELLVSQRNQLLSVVQNTQQQLADKETGLADLSDRASGGFEDELALGLMRIEAAQIEDIESAIERIDTGTYGICVDCQKAIPRKRLEVLPFAQRCLECEGSKERRARIQARQSDDNGESALD